MRPDLTDPKGFPNPSGLFYGLPQGEVLMTFGEGNREFVFELLRWLGPGAELVEPEAWRQALRDELKEMLRRLAEKQTSSIEGDSFLSGGG